MDKKITAMRLIKWLVKAHIYVFISFIFLLHVFFPFFFFFISVTCITGVILFVYLCFTRQLVISRKIFFLLPYILWYFVLMRWLDDGLFSQFVECFAKWPWSFYDVVSVCYVIIKCGMPFLLYCFLQITGWRLAIIARIFCFVLPVFAFISLMAVSPQ
jgi:hypothetical protein